MLGCRRGAISPSSRSFLLAMWNDSPSLPLWWCRSLAWWGGEHDSLTNEDRKQLASDTQDKFLVANLESFVCSRISKIVFPEQGVNVYLDKEHHIRIQIFLSYRLSQHPWYANVYFACSEGGVRLSIYLEFVWPQNCFSQGNMLINISVLQNSFDYMVFSLACNSGISRLIQMLIRD